MPRFIVAGAVNTAFCYGIYALLLGAGLHFALANLLSTLAGIVSGFALHARFVFGGRDWRRIGRYAAVWSTLYAVHTGLIGLLVSAGLGPYLSGAVAIVPVALLGFVAQRRFTFGPPRGDQTPPAASA